MKKLLVFLVVFMVTLGLTSLVFADDGIDPTLPIKGEMRDITQGLGKLITIGFNIFAVMFIGMAGFAATELVMGMVQQNPMMINHQRQAIFYSFIGLAGLALIPMLANIILKIFGFNFIG